MSNTRRRRSVAAIAAIALAAAATLPSQMQAQATPASSPPPAPMPAIDTAAVNAVGRMATYLNTLLAMQVTGQITTEKVLTSGEKIQLMSTIDLIAERPSHIRISMKDERKERLLVFDGSTVTIWAPRQKYWTKFTAPSTLNALADTLEAKYNMELPLVDLFRWGTPQSDLGNVTHAMDVGPATIDGVTVEQYAFRQEGLDWQIWIQRGDYPLPRKLVLTTLTDDARPQHMITYDWNLAPSYSSEAFTFEPPADSHEIPIATVSASALTGR